MPGAKPGRGSARTGLGTVAEQRGQGTVELALLLPVVALLTLVVVQIGLIARDSVLVNHAVREAARQAAVDPEAGVAFDAATAAIPGLDPERLDLVLGDGRATGDVLTVELRYASPTAVPIVGALLGDVSLTAAAAVRVE